MDVSSLARFNVMNPAVILWQFPQMNAVKTKWTEHHGSMKTNDRAVSVCGGNSERVSVRVCDCTDVCLHVCRCVYDGPWSFTRVTFQGFTTFKNPLGGIVAKLSQI